MAAAAPARRARCPSLDNPLQHQLRSVSLENAVLIRFFLQLSWSKSLVRKWFNIRGKSHDFHADGAAAGTGRSGEEGATSELNLLMNLFLSVGSALVGSSSCS
jgi:hypothetical protein